MKIDDKLIDRLSKLSHLNIDDADRASLKGELNDILDFVENLNEVDVSNINATFTTLEGGTLLREDIVVKDEELSNNILRNAPKSEDNYFVVPQIIE